MKTIGVLLCCVFLAVQGNVLKSEVHKEWEKFMAEHKKAYASDVEHEFRFKIFSENLLKIIKHNREYKEGKTTFSMGMNKFGDLLESEVLDKLTGYSPLQSRKHVGSSMHETKSQVPSTMDWRQKGAVTPVKDQGSCGSCWAFSATGSLEGQNFMKTGSLVGLSEQNLMDCSRSYGNMGCNGGFMEGAFQYVKDNDGIDTEASYPYEERDASTCRYNAANKGATATGYVEIPVGSEEALKNAVGSVGPVSVGIYANSGFQFYNGGVFKDSRCNSYMLNHGVLAVGYGTENGQDYWLVKNSWGAWWGDSGYIKMARNYNNMCGISQDAAYPTM